MIQISDDNLIVRSTAWICFWLTAIVLFYCEAHTLFFLYTCIAVSLIYGEQNTDEIHEYDTLRRYEHLWTQRPFSEVDGNVLLGFGMEDIIASVFEEPVFPTSYKLPNTYLVSMLAETRPCKAFDINYMVEKTTSDKNPFLGKAKFLQSKINLDPRFEHVFLEANYYYNWRYLKFKTVALISTVFIGETFLTRGIYPTSSYDYDRTHMKMQFDNIYLEFLLVSASRDKKLFFRVNKDKIPKALEEFILDQLQSTVDIYEEYRRLKRH